MSNSDASRRTPVRRPLRASATRSLRRGFTLLEVLAAVALLGILYSLLARVAIEGLRAEGDSKRRLEASLLADERVSDLLGAMLPALGHLGSIEGDFGIEYDVTVSALPPEWSETNTPMAPPLLLATNPDGNVPALRTVQITVSWMEGASPRHISRTTYMVDFQIVAALAAAAPPPP